MRNRFPIIQRIHLHSSILGKKNNNIRCYSENNLANFCTLHQWKKFKYSMNNGLHDAVCGPKPCLGQVRVFRVLCNQRHCTTDNIRYSAVYHGTSVGFRHNYSFIGATINAIEAMLKL